MKNQPGKKRGRMGTAVTMIAYLLMGVSCGFTIARLLPQMREGLSFGMYIAQVCLSVLLIYLAIFLQLVLHEAGHMLFGLLTGYRFSSFRIANVMWIKTPEGIKCKRFSLAGTGGQCLLEPPAWTENGIPYVLYNLGGVIVNIALSLLFFLFARLSSATIWHDFCLMMSVCGVAFAISNGIPMSVGAVDNDGRNAVMLGKSKEALHAFWVQLSVASLQAQGLRLKEMPEEFFRMPADDTLNNTMMTAVAVFCCSRLIDGHRLNEAQAQMDRLLGMDDVAIEGLQRQMLLAESLYCALLLGSDEERLQALHSRELLQFLKAMRNNPTVLRVEHAWLLLHDHDEEAAQKKLDQMEKQAPRYPYPQEIESERELVQLALDRWADSQSRLA